MTVGGAQKDDEIAFGYNQNPAEIQNRVWADICVGIA